MELDRLIDDIYSAAVAPGLWPGVLDRLAEIAGAEGAVLSTARTEKARTISSQSIESKIRLSLTPEWINRNEREKRLIQLNAGRFLTDLDAFALDEMDTIPYYRDFLRPLGLGWCAVTTMDMPTGGPLVFCIERAFDKGPVQQSAIGMLDGLRPHLARASALSAQASIARAQSETFALETIGLAAAVLSDGGRVLAANRLFTDDVPGITASVGDLLKFKDRGSEARFSALMIEGGTAHGRPGAGAFILRSDETARPQIAHLFPLNGDGNDVFAGVSSLLYLAPLANHATMPVELLQDIFDLTPAEAKIAKLIGKGSTIFEISTILRIQESTVRVHLKSIFLKTGVNRQSDLVRLTTLTTGGHRTD